MQLIGLRRNVDYEKGIDEVIRYELRVHEDSINTLYQDKYGVYVCTKNGRMYKVDYSFEELEAKI